MANDRYNRGLKKLSEFRWAVDPTDVGLLLVTSSYIFSRTHNTVADVVAFEASGSGYERKAIPLSARSVYEDDVLGLVYYRVSDGIVSWPALNVGNNVRVVLFLVTGSGLADNTNELLCYIDTGNQIPLNTAGGIHSINFASDGVFQVS